VFALRYAFTHGDLTRFDDVDRLLLDATDPANGTGADVRGAPGTLIVHELGLYVGGGLKL